MANLIVILILVVIFGFAGLKLYKDKKNNVRCSGCSGCGVKDCSSRGEEEK